MRAATRKKQRPACHIDAEERLKALNVDVLRVHLVEPGYICFETKDHEARTARFVKGSKGPQLDGVTYGWPVL